MPPAAAPAPRGSTAGLSPVYGGPVPGLRRPRPRSTAGSSPVYSLVCPRAPSVLQFETQTDIRLIKLRNRTSRFGVLHRLLKRLLAGAGHLGLQLQMTLRDGKTIAHFLESDGAHGLQTLRRQPRQPELRGERHGDRKSTRL